MCADDSSAAWNVIYWFLGADVVLVLIYFAILWLVDRRYR